MKQPATSRKTKCAKPRSLHAMVRRLEAENVMLKNYNGQLNTMLDAWYAAFGTNQLTHALARLEAAEKRVAKSSNTEVRHSAESAASKTKGTTE